MGLCIICMERPQLDWGDGPYSWCRPCMKVIDRIPTSPLDSSDLINKVARRARAYERRRKSRPGGSLDRGSR